MSICLFNARSVRNKTADIMDYIFDTKAVTETWLTLDNDAVNAELCPIGYRLLDQPRTGRCGGGTALLFRDRVFFFTVKKSACEMESFEYSDWCVLSQSGHKLRVVIIYRPPYSENHKD